MSSIVLKKISCIIFFFEVVCSRMIEKFIFEDCFVVLNCNLGEIQFILSSLFYFLFVDLIIEVQNCFSWKCICCDGDWFILNIFFIFGIKLYGNFFCIIGGNRFLWLFGYCIFIGRVNIIDYQWYSIGIGKFKIMFYYCIFINLIKVVGVIIKFQFSNCGVIYLFVVSSYGVMDYIGNIVCWCGFFCSGFCFCGIIRCLFISQEQKCGIGNKNKFYYYLIIFLKNYIFNVF